MTVPSTNLDRSQSVTLANPTPPTNVAVTYQGTPPTPVGLAPAPTQPLADAGLFADPLNGAVATQWTGTDALPVVAELAGKAEADGTEVTTVVGNTTGHSVLGDYTENPTTDHPSNDASYGVAAPVLELVSDAGDSTPDFTLTGDLVLGDTVRFQYSTNPGFGGATELTNTIDAAEDAANEITFTTGALALGTWYFRARIERPGLAVGAWSNVETLTLSISAEVSQFLARTSGLDTLHTNLYTALIDGLVADAAWPLIDAFYITASQGASNILQNIKSSLYTATLVGAPTFTPDSGIIGATGKYFKTGFNPSTAVGAQYQRDSAHMGVWVKSDDGTISINAVVGTESGTTRMYLMPNYGAGFTAYFRINTNDGITAAVANGAGFTLANRSSSTNVQGYRNGGAPIATSSSDASAVLNNAVFTAPDQSIVPDSVATICAICFGGSLTQALENAIYARLRTFLTGVGVP